MFGFQFRQVANLAFWLLTHRYGFRRKTAWSALQTRKSCRAELLSQLGQALACAHAGLNQSIQFREVVAKPQQRGTPALDGAVPADQVVELERGTRSNSAPRVGRPRAVSQRAARLLASRVNWVEFPTAGLLGVVSPWSARALGVFRVLAGQRNSTSTISRRCLLAVLSQAAEFRRGSTAA